MTAYQGGKARISKQIYNILKTYDNGQPYFEPFLGLGSVMRLFALENNNRKLIGSDTNTDIILLLKALQEGWQPPNNISKSEYYKIRDSGEHSALHGFAGISCVFRGMFFHSYWPKAIEPASRRLPLLGTDLRNVEIKEADYTSFNPEGMLIYCDPPYRNNKITTKYFKNFDNDKFWNIMREWSKKNTVIISEYSAPEDFECIWEKEIKLIYGNRKEKLFCLNRKLKSAKSDVDTSSPEQ